MAEDKDFYDNNEEHIGDTKKSEPNFGKEEPETGNEFSQSYNSRINGNPQNKKILAGVLAIVLGAFGIHKFILGYTKEGIILLVITLILGALTCGVAGWAMSVVGVIEGIIYLTKSDEEFYRTYQLGHKPWF